jgi:hypothetical protein
MLLIITFVAYFSKHSKQCRNNGETLQEKKIVKFRRRAIFPKDYSLSIVAAITFNSHVRNGMALFHYAIDTEIKSVELNVA